MTGWSLGRTSLVAPPVPGARDEDVRVGVVAAEHAVPGEARQPVVAETPTNSAGGDRAHDIAERVLRGFRGTLTVHKEGGAHAETQHEPAVQVVVHNPHLGGHLRARGGMIAVLIQERHRPIAVLREALTVFPFRGDPLGIRKGIGHGIPGGAPDLVKGGPRQKIRRRRACGSRCGPR